MLEKANIIFLFMMVFAAIIDLGDSINVQIKSFATCPDKTYPSQFLASNIRVIEGTKHIVDLNVSLSQTIGENTKVNAQVLRRNKQILSINLKNACAILVQYLGPIFTAVSTKLGIETRCPINKVDAFAKDIPLDTSEISIKLPFVLKGTYKVQLNVIDTKSNMDLLCFAADVLFL